MWQTVSFLFLPVDTRGLSICYLFWISLFLGINILWDVYTPLTPRFHVSALRSKVETLFNAGTFASSLLVISSLFDNQTAQTVSAAGIAHVMAGLSGLLISVSGLCPYVRQVAPQEAGLVP